MDVLREFCRGFFAPIPQERGLDLAALLRHETRLARRLWQTSIRRLIAIFAVFAHIIVDTRYRRLKALIRRADFAIATTHRRSIGKRTPLMRTAIFLTCRKLAHFAFSATVVTAAVISIATRLSRSTKLR